MSEWKEIHRKIIIDFLVGLNKVSNRYVLKGGTALLIGYNLDRFSEDIDLDSTDKSTIKKYIIEFCKKNKYTYRIAKDTDTVKRYFIKYNEEYNPLKVEISYRQKVIDKEEYSLIKGINIYDIETISIMKSNAYKGRDKLRDLYDLCFICKHYWDDLNKFVKRGIKDSVGFKGIEQFDYLIQYSEDSLIDKEKLSNDFLVMMDKLNLVYKVED